MIVKPTVGQVWIRKPRAELHFSKHSELAKIVKVEEGSYRGKGYKHIHIIFVVDGFDRMYGEDDFLEEFDPKPSGNDIWAKIQIPKKKVAKATSKN